MKIEIQAEGMNASAGLRRFVRRRIDFAFSTRSAEVSRVFVHVSDGSEANGSPRKRCLVQVSMPDMPDVIVENCEPNLYVAVHRSVDRAGWTVARKLERQRRRARARMIIDTHPAERAEPDRAA